MFLKISQNLQENTCTRVSLLINKFIKKETLAKVLSCEFCEMFKNIFFTELLRMTASESITVDSLPESGFIEIILPEKKKRKFSLRMLL